MYPAPYTNSSCGSAWSDTGSNGWTQPHSSPQIGFLIDPAATVIPTTSTIPSSNYNNGFPMGGCAIGFDLALQAQPMTTPQSSPIANVPSAPPFDTDSDSVPLSPSLSPPTSARQHRSPSKSSARARSPKDSPRVNMQISNPAAGFRSFTVVSSPGRDNLPQDVPIRSPNPPSVTPTANNEVQRNAAYQQGLKNMAALMTDVELTDDVIKGLRDRFDLQK